MGKLNTKNILMFSYNPVPTEEYENIEGSALRFWRIANALRTKGYNNITIAIWNKFPQRVHEVKGIKLVNFSDDPEVLREICAERDVVIFSCAMGKLSSDIYSSIDASSRVITDAYSPMYVEFLTKSQDSSEDNLLVEAYRSYAQAFNNILVGADHILIANDNQKHFYRGVLGGIGALPEHDDSRFVYLPAFVEKERLATSRTKIEGKVNVLWFGGIYPWFDIADIVEAFSKPALNKRAQLTIVGGSNPFYPKENMRYNGKYSNAVRVAKEKGLIGKTVFFEDWVKYNQRVSKVFNKADIAVSVNSDFIENEYSFRLRVADLVGNGVPILTNGGDYLGEELIKSGVAFRLDLSSPEKIVTSFLQVLNDNGRIEHARKLLRTKYYEALHLDMYIENLISCMESNTQVREKKDEIHSSDLQDQMEFNSRFPLTSLTSDDVERVSTKNLTVLLVERLKKVVKVHSSNVIKKQ